MYKKSLEVTLMAKPAFRLRKATTGDFQDFYNFYVHFCYQWLLLDEIATEEDDPFKEHEFEDNYFCSKEDMERIHLETINFNIHDFEKHLEWYRIFMITVGDKAVGYVKLENYCRQFIVRDWRMHYEYMDPELLDSLLEKFETYAPKKANRIQVIAWDSPHVNEFLERHGYHKHCVPFFEKDCTKNPE